MRCNNDCYWQHDEMCCPAITEVETLKPDNLDCPELLRSDFEEARYKLTDELINDIVVDFNFVESLEIRNFLIELKKKRKDD